MPTHRTGFIARLALLALLATPFAHADNNSPAGLWKSIDDDTGKPKALIRITESNGEWQGKIEKLFREPDEEENPVCVKCTGPLKDKPILGMTILSGMKKDGISYDGGTILDPANGKFYKSKMTLGDGGATLNVRGYIGVPMIGRTQTWLRME